MTDDERMNARLRQLAEDYNRPPEIVPRELMWEAIQAELGTRDAGSGSGEAVGLARRARMPRWVYLAAAAVMLLAVGIQIGRRMSAGRAAPQTAVVPDAVSTPGGAVPTAGAPQAPPSGTTGGQQVAVAEPAGGRASGAGAAPGERPLDPAMPDDATARAYTVAAAQHLTEAEAMLTAFKGDLSQGRMDAQLASWGKDLLANTRLLLDSPAARDPVRRRLLQDLELVLVQIVQLSPGTSARDRDLIRGALTDEQVLTRLRTAIPVQKGT